MKKGYAVFMAMLEYSDTGEIIIPDEYYDAFEPIKEEMDENARKYEKICERNRINGQNGGRLKKPKETEKTQSDIKNPVEPKKAEYDYEYEYDNEFKKKERKKEKDEFNLPFSPVNGSRRINKLTKLSDVGGGFM